jgi:hypothetical protein
VSAIVPLFQSGLEFAACMARLVQPQLTPSSSRSLGLEKLNVAERGNRRLGMDGQDGSLGRRQEGGIPEKSCEDTG